MVNVLLGTHLAYVVGKKTAEALHAAFDMETVGDLLEHYPRRYVRRGHLSPLGQVREGEHVSVVAQVVSVDVRDMQSRRGNLVEAIISDGHEELSLTWFNQRWRAGQLTPGRRGVFSGKIGVYRGRRQLAHPDFDLFDETDNDLRETVRFLDELIPLYPASARMPTWNIRRAVGTALDRLEGNEDPVPPWVLRIAGGDESLLSLREALEGIHRPRDELHQQRAERSLKFREAFELLVGLNERKRLLSNAAARAWPLVPGGLRDRFDEQLPFALTGDQQRVAEVLARELEDESPMHRLLQGEVASGKTVVALRAMLQVADGGGQSALLAPTEVLAAQHYRSIVDTLGPELTELVRPVLLTGQIPAKERKRVELDIASGAASIVVGTHALLSETTTFDDLAFVVIDEQHRFGVEQRETLRRKSRTVPHVLVMTATPIPRTVALTSFGDLDVSTIKELPPGRPGTTTHVVPVANHPSWIERAWQRADEEIARGRQVYVVCPAISATQREEGVDLDRGEDEHTLLVKQRTKPQAMANVEATVDLLQRHATLRRRRISALTGAMSAAEKEAAMTAFSRGEIDVLVATTVIEVGVNVPNASMMIILDAGRFGISQLHQLRGRVGRGHEPGLCLLVTTAEEGTGERSRVEAVASTSDGFELADIDLEERREGNVLGSAQSGSRSALKLLRVTRDTDTIDLAKELADRLVKLDPDHSTIHPLLHRISERWGSRLSNLGKS